jgi:hypothetical protein
MRLFNVADNEHIVSAVRLDEDESPENPAEEAIAEEIVARRLGAPLCDKRLDRVMANLVEVQHGISVKLQTVSVEVQEGKLVPIAVTSAKRLPSLPNIPAIAESVPGFELMVWFGALIAVNLQTAFLSPPVAMSAYYLRNVVPQWSLGMIYKGMGDFMVLQVICLAVVLFFPDIVLWLPRALR